MTSQPLARAQEYLVARRFTEAAQLCEQVLQQDPSQALAAHLLGLAYKEQGDARAGEQWLRHSLVLAPHRADFHANLGNLLRRQGRLAEAIVCFRGALALDDDHREARLSLARSLKELGEPAAAEAESRTLLTRNPEDAEAHCALGAALRSQGQLVPAEAAYRRALVLRPSYGVARHNLGALLCESDRAEEALIELERAEASTGATYEGAINRGHALLKLGRLLEAEQTYARAVVLRPRSAEAQLSLAKLRFMLDDPSFARTLVEAVGNHPADVELQLALGDVLRLSQQSAAAEHTMHRAFSKCAPHPLLHCALSRLLRERGALAEAEQHAMAAAVLLPGHGTVVETVVDALLAQGQADRALPWIEQQRQREPQDQRWTAHWLVALRVLDDRRYRELCDYETLVQCYDVAAPAGWGSIADLNHALQSTLGARHRLRRHPLDQSLRHGSQTTRSLLAEPEPAVRALLEACRECLVDYANQWVAHPLLAGRSGIPVIAKCWSVELYAGGYHVSHIHPEGWISSVYYVTVPPEVLDSPTRAGWLKFGEPGISIPRCSAERFVQPRPGRLVLFPSFLWHGTEPIVGPAPRLTIAFDAVAARAGQISK